MRRISFSSLIFISVVIINISIKIIERIYKKSFLIKYSIKKLPKGIKVIRVLKKYKNTYNLGYPHWSEPKKDGTRDLRKAYNRIIWEKSILYVDNYKVSSKIPYDIIELVKKLRLKGINIELCLEEKKKREILIQKKKIFYKSKNIQSLINNYSKKPRDFEILCADIFKNLGYNYKLTPQTNDGGYDIVLYKDKKQTIVECKCYNLKKKVGRPDIQKLVGANQVAKADEMIFITTSDFTDEAKEYAKITEVKLINGNKMINILEEQGVFNIINIEPTLSEIQLEIIDIEEYIPNDIF